MQSANEGAKDEGSTTFGTTQNFKFTPVTLSIQTFYKQVSLCTCMYALNLYFSPVYVHMSYT